MALRRLYLDNEHTIRVLVTQLDPSTGAYIGVTGLGLAGWLADAADADTPIDAAVEFTLTEMATGDYSAVLDAATTTAALTPFAHRTVLEVVTDGAGLRVVTPYLVVPTREI